MTAVAAYLATVLAIAALACGHQGQDWPLAGVWRHIPRPSWARGRLRARIYATRHRRQRTRPLWAHSQPLDYEEAA